MSKLLSLKNPSVKFESRIPDFFDLEESKLKDFMRFYYEWLEREANVENETRSFLSYNDLDFRDSSTDTYKRFNAFIRHEFLQNLPAHLNVDERFLIKRIRDFYKSKGTEESIRILFKLLFNEDAEVSYPGAFILRASDGRWVVEESLKIILFATDITQINPSDFVVGTLSYADAKIERFIQYTENSLNITEIYISNRTGEFTAGETISSKLTGDSLGVIIPNGIVKYPGRYLTTDGHLSSDRKLQDNYFYQEYSYVIRSPRSANYYENIVKDLVHPAGMVFFSEVFFQTELPSFDIDITPVETKNTKIIQYPIDLFQYVQLIVESSQDEIGGTNARYVYEFVLNMFDGPAKTQDYENFSIPVTFENMTTMNGGMAHINGRPHDSFEVYNPSRNNFVKVKDVISEPGINRPSSVRVFNGYPYWKDSGLRLRKKTETKARIETQLLRNYRHNFGASRISDFNSYNYRKHHRIQNVRSILLRDLKDVRFVDVYSGRKELIGNTKSGSILELNNSEKHVITHIYDNELLRVRDANKTEASNSSTTVYNI